jgi:hypothetical protein
MSRGHASIDSTRKSLAIFHLPNEEFSVGESYQVDNTAAFAFRLAQGAAWGSQNGSII